MYMVNVCFYVCCSECVGVCEYVCCVLAVVEDSVFNLGVLKYVVCLCKGYNQWWDSAGSLEPFPRQSHILRTGY